MYRSSFLVEREVRDFELDTEGGEGSTANPM